MMLFLCQENNLPHEKYEYITINGLIENMPKTTTLNNPFRKNSSIELERSYNPNWWYCCLKNHLLCINKIRRRI